jgi:hypothetical protein
MVWPANMKRGLWCLSSVLLAVATASEDTDSDLVVQIGHISQPYNCTLFLDNLEVRGFASQLKRNLRNAHITA